MAVFPQFDFRIVYKRLYDIVYIANPLTRSLDRLAFKRVLSDFFGIKKIEGESSIIFGLDEAVNFLKVETTYELCSTLVFIAEQLPGRQHAETGLNRGLFTIHGFRKESFPFSR